MSHVSPDLLRRFDVSGPRYTSYPTADRFSDSFGCGDYVQALQERRAQALGKTKNLSLYVHIPFCESICYYCACNKIITKHHDISQKYLGYLAREVDLHTRHCGRGQPVSQLHLGGGSPTFLSDDELTALMAMLREHFTLMDDGEYSVEVDPRTVTVPRLELLMKLGLNRLSFGIQDFNEEVQKAVHRIQPVEQVFELMQAARAMGFKSINADLIYGLPRQTEQSFAKTIEQVIALRPDRLAMYAYAHLPERFKPQRRIIAEELPQATDKVMMLSRSITALMDAGYTYVGMDHFALPDDPLAIAKRQGRLHRNFQGYSTQPDCDLIGLGVSSIGRVGITYSQNEKTLEGYYDLIDADRIPVVRGITLSRDDLIRREVIMALMCQGRLDYESIELGWLIDFQEYFEPEMQALDDLEQKGLVKVSNSGIDVTDMGWFFVRAVGMVFDRYLRESRSAAKFSRIL